MASYSPETSIPYFSSPIHGCHSFAMPPMIPMSPTSEDGFSGTSSRRSSTDGEDEKSAAARRASHNAVERQRRDKLNARIHELASLLPNLAGVRRPSRIAITKSSIAHIHGSRRHRMMAAYQLRALHAENASLREEVNGWRRQAGMPNAVEPHRDHEFGLVYSGAEPEINELDAGEDDDYEERLYGVAPFSRLRPSQLPRLQSPAPEYGISPVTDSTSSASSDYPPPYVPGFNSTPPSTYAGPFAAGPGPCPAKFDVGALPPPSIACPTPANPFEAQHLMLKSEEWASYGTPPMEFHESHQPHGGHGRW